MRRTLYPAAAVAIVAALLRPPIGTDANDQPDTPGAFREVVAPVLKRYCYRCHSAARAEAEIDLEAFVTDADVRAQPDVWVKVRRMLDTGQMPPKESRQPADAERETLQGWVRDFLTHEAEAHAGDPGPVVLRRLSNAEYTYTIRDLTGVDSLDPAAEFPVDGAAGEGFTNTGSGQGMSPALVRKYLDAAKRVADHAVLLPDGIRFSPHTSRRDQTDELLARIQAFYRRYTADGGGTSVDLQGIKFDTNQGGVLPVERYLAATLAERDALTAGRTTVEAVAEERSLNAKYLATLWRTLTAGLDEPSPWLDDLRAKWRRATPADAAALAADIEAFQDALWKFNPVGHVGRPGGPKAWLEAVTPIATRHEFRIPLPVEPTGGNIVVTLSAHDLGDGNQHDLAVWQRPRIEFAGHPPIPLRDAERLADRIRKLITAELPRAEAYLAAVAELRTSSEDVEQFAGKRGLNPTLLANWGKLVGVGRPHEIPITGRLTDKAVKVHGHDAVNGWASDDLPNLLTNRSDQPITFLTLTVPARGVTVHPSPERESVVTWRSPITGRIRVEGLVADADDKCGNGAAWRVEVRSAAGRNVLAEGVIDNGREQRFHTDKVAVAAGDLMSLVINPRDRNHTCDTTHVEMKLTEIGGNGRVWDLAADVVDDVLNGNPLPDKHGNADVWHFCSSGGEPKDESGVPPGSALARWRSAVTEGKPADELAAAVALALTSDGEGLSEADRMLRQRLLDWKGPLGWATGGMSLIAPRSNRPWQGDLPEESDHPRGGRSDRGAISDYSLRAPETLAFRIPVELATGGELVTAGTLHPETGREGSVQLRVSVGKSAPSGITAGVPVLANPGTEACRRVEAAMAEFRDLFPPALCYARIVPVDEVVTLTLFHREDGHLRRLMLTEAEAAELDRLWDELLYVGREPLKLAVSFEQIYEFATQDRPDLVKAFAPMRGPINERAAAFRERLVATEPAHLDGVLEFAGRAWRRPLTDDERSELTGLYQRLRGEEIAHEDAIRLTLARVLTSPAFLYKLEHPAAGSDAAPVSDLELATRLSYFLWSSAPDAELRQLAEAGRLIDDNALTSQTRRMLADPRTRRLAEQFACQWLHVRDFDRNDDKNETLYPEFAGLRGPMYEETVRYFEDLFRNDGSILGILDSDHTFLNEALAKHYGIPDVTGPEWRRVDGVRDRGRGGVLAMATFLASQSGASRTSPILRGNWVYETLLGERLPRPPADVPQLPESVPEGLTARQLIERHSSDAACARCHSRIDPYGFALERYDAIGRLRPGDADTKTTLPDGKTIDGIDGLRGYLTAERRDDFVRQFCRKLLGYALGREVQLSDEPLLREIHGKLKANGYRFGVAVEAIVRSRQFRHIRGGQR